MSGISKTIDPVLHTIEVTFATHGTWSDEPNMTTAKAHPVMA